MWQEQVYLDCLASQLCQLCFIKRDLDFLDIPQNITLVHYSDDSMLTGLTKQGAASTPGATCTQRWVISPGKVQGPATPVQCLYSGQERVRLCSLRGEASCCTSNCPTHTQNHSNHGLFEFWRQCKPHLGVLLWSFTPVLSAHQSKKGFCSRPSPLHRLPGQYNLEPMQLP